MPVVNVFPMHCYCYAFNFSLNMLIYIDKFQSRKKSQQKNRNAWTLKDYIKNFEMLGNTNVTKLLRYKSKKLTIVLLD